MPTKPLPTALHSRAATVRERMPGTAGETLMVTS